MNNSSLLIGILAGAVVVETILLVIPAPYPEPIYTLPAPSIAAVPANAMVDFGKVRIIEIKAWTDGSGALITTSGVDCMRGFVDNHHIDLLGPGDVVHLRGLLYGSPHLITPASFDCEVIPDGVP